MPPVPAQPGAASAERAWRVVSARFRPRASETLGSAGGPRVAAQPPGAGPGLTPESQAFLDLCRASPGDPLARSLPRPAGCVPRRRGPAPRPGPPTHRQGRGYTASLSSPSRTRRPAAARADGGAGGRRSRGGRGRGRSFPRRRAWGAESGGLSPRPRLAGPVPRLACPPGPPRARQVCGGGALQRGPKGPQVAGPTP